MKAAPPVNKLTLWRSEKLFNIDFAAYTLQHHCFPRHFHDYYIIQLVLKGADKFYCDGKTYIAQPGHLVLINPGEVHTGNTVADEDLHYFSCCPAQEALEQVASTLGMTLPADFRFTSAILQQPETSKKMQAFFESLYQGCEMLKQQELFLAFMHELLLCSIKTYSSRFKKTDDDKRVAMLKEYIRSGFKEDLSLEQMAAEVNLNPFHLVRLFKKCTGVSPYHYLLIVRTEYARSLLRNGYKVNEAALSAGFYDSSHLHRLVRKFTATSPKSFLSSKDQFCTIFTA